MTTRPVYYLTLLGVCNDLLRRRWLVAAFAMISASVAAVVVFLRPPTYTSSASFISDVSAPRRDREPAFPARAPDVTQPLDAEYYVTLILSQNILRATAASTYSIPTPTGVRTGTLADFYGLPASTSPMRIDDAARRLSQQVDLTYPGARIIVVNVHTFDPHLSRAIADRMLELVMEHNRQRSLTRAEAQVAFLSEATTKARGEMIASQEQFARFLSANRAFTASSPLALEGERLRADAAMKAESYRSLAGALERARAHDTRVAQVISVLDHPEVPAKPDPRGALLSTLAGGIGGAALIILLVTVGAQVARFREAGLEDLSELSARWRAGILTSRERRGEMHGRPGSAAHEGA